MWPSEREEAHVFSKIPWTEETSGFACGPLAEVPVHPPLPCVGDDFDDVFSHGLVCRMFTGQKATGVSQLNNI